MWRAIARMNAHAEDHRRALARWDDIRATLPERADRSSAGVTICSVAYRAKTCLELNEQLMLRLNPDTKAPDWLVFDNNTDETERLDAADPRFIVVRPTRPPLHMGYEHALGISELLSRVRTRFLLVLDPDCFVVYPNWLRDVPAYMIERRLGFFGTPMNPRRHNSYRYFPYMVCMFVDLARVSPRDLCFVPDVWQWSSQVRYSIRSALATAPKAGALFRWLLTEQWLTNGWRIKARFGDGRETAFECAQPVWDIDEELRRSGVLKRALHAMTPASLSPIPKQSGYCTARGFASALAPDAAALGWEEFMWRGEPFAFHVGSVHGRERGYQRDLARVLDAFASREASHAIAQ
jgi:hypothetical protein